MAKQTLKAAVELITSGRGMQDVFRCGIDGCPVGGWPETEQAMSRLCDVLPHLSERTYLAAQLVDRLYTVDHADRYRLRSGI